ncbi:MAG: ligase-associated DNA damage response endonuclease PdeM [Alphaproteobacteria bacterium]|nr:ligase-associated DNA damage response endonuclease PdeM [Alphaproteobacteria bacterium]
MSKQVSTVTVRLNGQPVICNADGTALFDGGGVLVVSDLHLEKGRALATTAPIPLYDTDATLAALSAAIERDDPQEVIFLGDSFHRSHLAASLAQPYRETLRNLAQGRQFTWLVGNHDPQLPDFLPGDAKAEHQLTGITFRHIADDKPIGKAMGGEVSGHYHPKIRIKTRARAISGKCFIHDGVRMIMPSFGAYTGGLSVFDPAIATLYPKKAEILFCHACQIYRYPYSQVIAPK